MAEVKVKITAQNEVRTGLQQALQETQKFGQEAKRAVSRPMTINPFAGDDRLGPLRELRDQARALRERARAPIETAPTGGGGEFASTSAKGASAIRGLAIDLANATSAGEVFQAVISRITTAFGGLIAASAGFAVGSLIRRTLEDAAAGLEGLIDQSQSLQQSFTGLLAPTTTFDQLSSAILGASKNIDGLIEANQKLQSGVGFQIADYINAFDLSSAANRATEDGVATSRLALATAIAAATQRENQLAEARTDEERKLIALQAQRNELLNAARGVSPETEQNLRGLFAAQDRRSALETEREITKERDKQAAASAKEAEQSAKRLAAEQERISKARKGIDQEIALADAKVRGDKTAEENAIQQRDFESILARGGTFEQAASFTNTNALQRQIDAAMAAQGQGGMTGSLGASSLQRIGFASNEFFDTRRREDPSKETKRAADAAKQIYELLKKGEPLVLPASS